MPEPRVDTIVRGGKVVTSSQVLDAAVAIKGEKIAALGPEELLPSKPTATSTPRASSCCPASSTLMSTWTATTTTLSARWLQPMPG